MKTSKRKKHSARETKQQPGFVDVPMRPCRICAELIPEAALVCNKCGAYQDWRRRFSTRTGLAVLALLLSILGYLTGAFPKLIDLVSRYNNRNSHTSFTVTNPEDNTVLYLKVLNTGRKSSILLGYRLQFLPLFPIEDAMLDLAQPYKDEATNIIAPGQPVTIGLTVGELELRKPGGSKLYTKDEIKSLLHDPLASNRQVKLQVDVKESNDPRRGCFLIKPRPYHTYTDEVAVHRIRKFVLGRMSG